MKTFGGDTPYSVMFGPDICGYSTQKVPRRLVTVPPGFGCRALYMRSPRACPLAQQPGSPFLTSPCARQSLGTGL